MHGHTREQLQQSSPSKSQLEDDSDFLRHSKLCYAHAHMRIDVAASLLAAQGVYRSVYQEHPHMTAMHALNHVWRTLSAKLPRPPAQHMSVHILPLVHGTGQWPVHRKAAARNAAPKTA